MRELIQKLGRVNTVIVITVFSILFSVILSSVISYSIIGPEFIVRSILIAITIPLIVAPLCAWPLMGLLMKIDSLEKKMRNLATYDSLTGLLSRQAFIQNAKSFIDFAQREQIPFSVIALDLDRFKKINDSYGHAAGDEILKHFATATQIILRKGDLIGRIGGEEFAILLPNTSQADADTLAVRLHQTIRESTIAYGHASITYSVSMGLVSLLGKETDAIEDILNRADQSLYLAKENGRDCTVTFNADKAH